MLLHIVISCQFIIVISVIDSIPSGSVF